MYHSSIIEHQVKVDKVCLHSISVMQVSSCGTGVDGLSLLDALVRKVFSVFSKLKYSTQAFNKYSTDDYPIRLVFSCVKDRKCGLFYDFILHLQSYGK